MLDYGFVVYSNESKVNLLGVSEDAINKYGAVSSEVSILMAVGALRTSRANVSVSITGFAGPAINAEQAGLVYIGCAFSEVESEYKKCCFSSMSRHEIQVSSAIAAMDFLLYRIFNKGSMTYSMCDNAQSTHL
ncbi:MAG: CinA family protein [Ehrlichia sp.]